MDHQLEIEEELKSEFTRFIEFGTLLDRKMRTYLVKYLRNKFELDKYVVPELNDRYFDYLKRALDNIFLIDGLLELAKQNIKIRRQVILDTLYWLRKTYKKVKIKAPHEEEQQRLEGWAITPLHVFIKRWNTLPQYLDGLYRREALDSYFFRDRFNTLIGNKTIADIKPAEKEQIETLIHDLLAQWDALLHAKILDFELAKFEEEQEAYLEFMDQKVQEYSKLNEFINPFSEYFGWDLSRKLWKETSFDILQHYDDLLKDEPSVKAFSGFIG